MYGKIVREISKGTYATVYETDKKYAVKVREGEGDGDTPDFLREMAVLRFLNHPNIISILDTRLLGDRRYVYMPLACISLEEYTTSDERTETLTIFYMYSLLKATAHCHKYGIIHRDIKPQNILLFADGTLKLADFGMAKWGVAKGQTHTGNLVTLWWRAPELLLGDVYYDYAIDMWSIGVTLFSMYGYKYIQGRNRESQLRRIYRLLGVPTEESWPGVTKLPRWKEMDVEMYDITDIIQNPEILDLTCKLMTWKPHRITAEEALEHPLFDRYPEVSVEEPNPPDEPLEIEYNSLWRAKMIEWIWKISLQLKIKNSTTLLAINIVDRYFTENGIGDEFWGYGVSALLLAIKSREFVYWGFDSFTHEYSREQLCIFELDILETLEYCLMTPYIDSLLKCKEHLLHKLVCLYFNYDWAKDWPPSRFLYEVENMEPTTCKYLMGLQSPIVKNLVI